MKNLKDVVTFLIKHENDFNGDKIFRKVFPIIYNELNERDNIDNIFIAFLSWWNKNTEFRLINDDINIINKFFEYYKGVYQLILIRDKVVEEWIAKGIINKEN